MDAMDEDENILHGFQAVVAERWKNGNDELVLRTSAGTTILVALDYDRACICLQLIPEDSF